MQIQHLKLSVKLIGSFILISLITLALGILCWAGAAHSKKEMAEAMELESITKLLMQRQIDHLN
jgi:hypothetical protein